MSFMDSLYRYQPNNTAVQEVLAGMLVWSLRNSEREFSRGLDGINLYSRRYPFLHQNELFQDRHLLYQAERVRYYFDQDDLVKGGNYFEEFKRLLTTSRSAPRRNSWILTAYLAASNYYFRQGDYSQAFDLIQQARREAPDDPYLDHRAGVLRNYF
jgi:tetratricopeptide (TPR) repeat protein